MLLQPTIACITVIVLSVLQLFGPPIATACVLLSVVVLVSNETGCQPVYAAWVQLISNSNCTAVSC